jgi:hypothetical protein
VPPAEGSSKFSAPRYDVAGVAMLQNSFSVGRCLSRR